MIYSIADKPATAATRRVPMETVLEATVLSPALIKPLEMPPAATTAPLRKD